MVELEPGGQETARHAPPTGKSKCGIATHQQRAQVYERLRCRWRPRPTKRVAKCRHHVPVSDRVRRGDVHGSGDLVVIADEAHCAQEVVDVDPTDPLLSRADAPAEAELRKTREALEGRRTVIE